jgi:hypothetical protein
MDKKRRRAFRVGMTGALYHSLGQLSILTIGLPTGNEKELRKSYRLLKNHVEKQTKKKIENFCTWVTKTDAKGTRHHAHIIWTSDETDWDTLFPLWQKINGGTGSLYIRRIREGNAGKAIRYSLQYASAQKGETVRFSQSLCWRPAGAEKHWLRMLASFRERIPMDEIKTDENMVQWLSRGNPEWMSALIADYNLWVAEQRKKREVRVFKIQTISFSCSDQTPRAHPFK